MPQEDPQVQVEVLEFLRAKGLRECGVCHQQLWRGPDKELGFGVGRDYAFLTHEDTTEYTRFVPVTCVNCGHTLWFNAFYLPARRPD